MIKIKDHLKDVHRMNQHERTRKGSLRLDMNESVSGLPKRIVKKVLSKIDADLLASYPDCRALRNKVARHNNLRPENICLANGSDAAIKYIYDAYVSPGDTILVTNPTFAMYPVYAKIFGAKTVTVDYKEDLTFPFEYFISRLSGDIRMAVVVNPNNPTGDVLDHRLLIRIIKKALNNDIILIVDEAYFYFYPYSVAQEVRRYKNLIVLRTFSKLCGLAGARLGYAIACPDIIDSLTKVKPTFDVDSLAAAFAEELLDRPTAIKDLIKEAADGKRYLTGQMDKYGIVYKEGHANFILIECRGRAGEITRKLARENILVNSGFSQPFLKDYIRVTVGGEPAMRRFWKAFIRIWAE